MLLNQFIAGNAIQPGTETLALPFIAMDVTQRLLKRRCDHIFCLRIVTRLPVNVGVDSAHIQVVQRTEGLRIVLGQGYEAFFVYFWHVVSFKRSISRRM